MRMPNKNILDFLYSNRSSCVGPSNIVAIATSRYYYYLHCDVVYSNHDVIVRQSRTNDEEFDQIAFTRPSRYNL